MITDFPEITSPFWNMSRHSGNGSESKKIDVILGGMETIGSAERSCDVDMMRDTFHTITEGAYSNLLFELFGKERVEAELEEFLKFDFFPRVGGGIGITRMIPALEGTEGKSNSYSGVVEMVDTHDCLSCGKLLAKYLPWRFESFP